ncbi:hypothetical protein QD47_08020 [Paenibacillus terrae]|uniref:Uncharacterized protein n=1 Tax=Paenibacillus terrae TaxID=159743 RepID=A0A0D7X4C5_9BACL|nr:hypothetical protein QD47_08020 [Paenibacillus terrae]
MVNDYFSTWKNVNPQLTSLTCLYNIKFKLIIVTEIREPRRHPMLEHRGWFVMAFLFLCAVKAIENQLIY